MGPIEREQTNKKISINEAMQMNRKDRRALGKANGKIKIPGTNIPYRNPSKNTVK